MQLRLTLRSDTTFGRGDGVAGLVDTEVEHDLTTGLPYLRGRTLKGLLVEECANLLYGLGESGAGPAVMSRLREAAGFLFGRPGSSLGTEAALHVGSAQLPKALREAVAADVEAERLDPRDVLDTLTTIRRQTAIDDATGAPQEGALRTTRVTVRDLPFYAPLDFDHTPTNDALALLAACARALHRGGTTRNRGRGRLRLRLYDPDDEEPAPSEKRIEEAEALTQTHYEHFSALVRDSGDRSAPQTTGAAGWRDPDDRTSGTEGASGAPSKKTLVYRVELEQPVIATAVEGDPNSSVSSNHLPGSALRGALIARYLRRFDQDDLAGDDRARRLFFDGRTRFLNAYPVARDAYGNPHATLPTPLSYYHEKGEKRELRDFARSSPSVDDDAGGETQWKRAGPPFQTHMHGELHLEKPERRVTVHNQRDRIKGRATEERGELFRYDALASGQTFQAAICCETAADAALLKELLEAGSRLQIGGARSADYGAVRIVGDAEQPDDPWHECGSGPPPVREDDGQVVVTLLSHALVRGAQGQFTVEKTAITRAINRALGFDESEKLSLKRAFVRNEVVGGFNRKWNLPLPQTLAAKMGSVLVLETPDPLPGDFQERLAALEREGIGARQAEGFGRVAVNRYGMDGRRDLPRVRDPDDEDEALVPDRRSTAHDPEAQEIAQHMADRLLRRQLDLALVKQAGQLARGFSRLYEHGSEPTPSQLGRLREKFRNAAHQPSQKSPDERRQGLIDFLDGLPPDARGQLKTGKFDLTSEHGTGTLWTWLRERIKDTHNPDDPDGAPASIWGDLDPDSRSLPQVGETAEAQRTDEWAFEYNLRLAHDVLARAAKIYKQQKHQ
jgi:CRISPR-associated protein Csx10